MNRFGIYIQDHSNIYIISCSKQNDILQGMGQKFQHFQLNDIGLFCHCRQFSKWTLHKSRPIMLTFHAAETQFFSGSHGAAESVLWSRRRVDRFHKPSGSRYVLRKRFPLQSYSGDGIETINPTPGRGLDS